ncbi:unnamed protein product [Zymoseptoria tritici ST99CH_1E4]|uniref:FAD-binding domain-containing protein n=1 Tax=Zymoseptoria tritici ST99CH_1E4 TaxID=1276532 RepID=A0A2H1FP96_ZYMTR|nr:unnamed protein product [Zymoseptoria tritici ST99CH_1E4]
MKIIIVGAGVAGLSAYLKLRKVLPDTDSHTFIIFESHKDDETQVQSASDRNELSDSAAIVGNSIVLSPSSIRLLAQIDPELYTRFKGRGYENHNFRIRTARGHEIALLPTKDDVLPVEAAISCPRYVLWECLQEVVGKDDIQQGKVVAVDVLHGHKPTVRLANGELHEADLVIGADGVHSVVKKGLFGKENEDRYAPQFEGFRGVGAFLDMDIPDSVSTHDSIVVTFGPTGSFGYCSSAPASHKRVGWWSNWRTTEPPLSSFMDAEEIQAGLYDRHKTWKDPVIQACIKTTTTDRIYPLWTTPDLPHWGTNGVVLLGDSAHTLQATSGQGAAQALEDVVTFSLLLAHFTAKAQQSEAELSVEQAIDAASKGLFEIRHARVRNIRTRARNLYASRGRIDNVVLEYLYYAYLYAATNVRFIGEWMIGNSFIEPNEWNAEAEVQKYLERTGL